MVMSMAIMLRPMEKLTATVKLPKKSMLKFNNVILIYTTYN